MSSAIAIPLAAPTEAESTSGPDTFVAGVRSLLAAQQFVAAQRESARAAGAFPNDPWLQRANRVLNPGKAVSVAARGPDRTREFDWLRRNSGAYRGQWVALLGDELIAADEDIDVVLREVRARLPDAKPLVHRID